jgi:hypothetical protein
LAFPRQNADSPQSVRMIHITTSKRTHVLPTNPLTSAKTNEQITKVLKCAHGKSAHYVHVASTNEQSHSRRTRALASKPHKVPASRPTVHKINNDVYAHDNRGATTASNSTQDRATTNTKASLCWGSPKGKKGTVRRGSPPRQPANPNIHVQAKNSKVYWHKSPKVYK